MNTFDTNRPIGEIVAAFPTAGLIFKKYRIDFCCGGDRLLSAAILDKQLDVKDLAAELQAAYSEAKLRKERETDWTSVDYATLVDHVVHTHHAYLKNELPGIGEFVARIRNVHGSGHPELIRLDELYRELKAELEDHLQKEETLVFPYIKLFVQDGDRNSLSMAVAAIQELEAEHSAVGSLLHEMRTITADYLLPPEACRTYTVSFQKLEELEDDLFQHIHLENNIMFPGLEQELAATSS